MTEEQQYDREFKSEARLLALGVSETLNEPLLNMGMANKQKIMDDAEELYQWAIQDL